MSDVPAVNSLGRTVLPLRTMAELTGLNVGQRLPQWLAKLKSQASISNTFGNQ